MDFISGENFNEIFPILIYNKQDTHVLNFIKTNKNIIYTDDISTNINNKLNKNNIFYMKFECLFYFITQILPQLTKPFIIITHNSDRSSGMNSIILNHPLLVKWYGQNMNVISNKTEGIPIGLENRYWGRTNFEIIQKYKNLTKDKLLYLNFSLKTNKNRKPIMDNLLKKGFKQNEKLPWNEYIKDLASHKFAISPNGNGVDCHRTWECLYLGVVPIVTKSIVMSFFKDLPILFVNNYDVITEDFLNLKYKEFQDKTFSLDKLSLTYWKNKILKLYEKYNYNSLQKS